MKLAIMQPYFMPYIGYFQLMSAVDTFVVYDNIQYTKKGWINRNRILVGGKDAFVTLPLKKDSDYLNINQRYLSEEFSKERTKILNKIKGSYSKAPFFVEVFPLIESIFHYESKTLFDFIFHSIEKMHSYLNFSCALVKSSELDVDIEVYKGQEKVIEICKVLKARTYINSIGGLSLYEKKDFEQAGIALDFISSEQINYQQFNQEFVPWLSMIDVLMFNSKEDVKRFLPQFKLI